MPRGPTTGRIRSGDRLPLAMGIEDMFRTRIHLVAAAVLGFASVAGGRGHEGREGQGDQVSRVDGVRLL